jgi:hypothetical protein
LQNSLSAAEIFEKCEDFGQTQQNQPRFTLDLSLTIRDDLLQISPLLLGNRRGVSIPPRRFIVRGMQGTPTGYRQGETS